jgi:hypothetical protein
MTLRTCYNKLKQQMRVLGGGGAKIFVSVEISFYFLIYFVYVVAVLHSIPEKAYRASLTLLAAVPGSPVDTL